MKQNKIEVYRLEDNKFQVLHDSYVDIMTLDEVMVLLSTPVPEEKENKQNFQMQLEEFWNSYPVYPRM